MVQIQVFDVLGWVLSVWLGFAASAFGSDQTLGFSTYLGGNSNDSIREIGFDPAGNVVVAMYGDFQPSTFPGSTVFGPLGTGGNDNIAVLKFDPTGTLLWSTLIGGSGKERAYGLEIDAAGDIYIAGASSSPDLPTTPGAFDETYNGGDPNPVHGARDCYALKLSGDGQNLVYCTYLGGSKNEAARGGLALAPDGSIFVVGYTKSPDYLGPIPQHVNSFAGSLSDAIVTKLSPDGSSVVYNRFIGSAGFDIEEVIVGARSDASGRLHFAAIVRSPGAPTTDGSTYNGGEADLYIGRLSPDGTTLEYASYFGGSGAEFMEHRFALDAAGNTYVCGATTSTDFPTQGSGQLGYGGGPADAFLVKFDPTGQMVWSTFIGGSDEDSIFGPVLDNSGRIWLGGYTQSTDYFTTPDAYDSTLDGPRDATIRRYAPDGTLEYSTLFGGSGSDYGRYIGVDPSGRVYLVGETDSPDLPTSAGAHQQNYLGGSCAFLTQLLPAPCVPDVNGDGSLDAADFTAWIAAFNAGDPTCDQNADSLCDPSDFSAWIANFNAGC
ncbi:MAG TPA: hypothetical protein ENJ00_08335 [Phycisphaerales bacterium]|nr:hypothetical protein [Phycisphaerales bacterium]